MSKVGLVKKKVKFENGLCKLNNFLTTSPIFYLNSSLDRDH